MRILQVTSGLSSRYIPLKGWSSVERALGAYESGVIECSDATHKKQVTAMSGAHGDLAATLYVVAASINGGGQTRLVKNMLDEARERLEASEYWQIGFEYGAMGTRFFKTTVSIAILSRDHDIYGLGINAAYVGNEPEENLATHLGIPRSLTRGVIVVETQPIGKDRFEFNFEQIVRMLDSCLKTNDVRGETIVQAMMNTDKFGNSIPRYNLFQDNGFEVTIRPGRVGSRFDRHEPERRLIDTWQVSGPTLSGPLGENYNGGGTKQMPSFVISLAERHPSYLGGCEDVPVWQPERKERLTSMTSKIADALRG